MIRSAEKETFGTARRLFSRVRGAWLFFEQSLLLNVATFLALFATAVMMMEASSRVFLHHSYFWAEELVRYPMIWAFFMTLGCAGRAGHMIRTEMLVERLPDTLRYIANIISTGLGVLFSGVLFYASVPQIMRYYAIGMRTESTLDFPMWALFLAMPIGAVLMGLYYIGAFVTALRGGDPYSTDMAAAESPDEPKGAVL